MQGYIQDRYSQLANLVEEKSVNKIEENPKRKNPKRKASELDEEWKKRLMN